MGREKANDGEFRTAERYPFAREHVHGSRSWSRLHEYQRRKLCDYVQPMIFTRGCVLRVNVYLFDHYANALVGSTNPPGNVVCR